MRRQTETAPSSRGGSPRTLPCCEVRYPGIGGLVSFDVADDRARRSRPRRPDPEQTSLGGVRSTMESRHRWEGDRIPDGLLRLSVGLEDVDALWADLSAALGRA